MSKLRSKAAKIVASYHDWLNCAPVPQDIYAGLHALAQNIDQQMADSTHEGYLQGCFGKKAACDMYCVIINEYVKKHSRFID